MRARAAMGGQGPTGLLLLLAGVQLLVAVLAPGCGAGCIMLRWASSHSSYPQASQQQFRKSAKPVHVLARHGRCMTHYRLLMASPRTARVPATLLPSAPPCLCSLWRGGASSCCYEVGG